MPKPFQGHGFSLDFACARMRAFPAMSGVVHTPGFPLETEFGMKSQIAAAAAPGWNSLPKPPARPGRMHRAALGSSVLNSQLGSQTPPCSCVSLRHGAQEEFPFPGSRPHHFHTSTEPLEFQTWQEGEEPGKMPPWLLLCCRHRQWISGKRIQQIPIWKSLAPRTFPYPSENPPC